MMINTATRGNGKVMYKCHLHLYTCTVRAKLKMLHNNSFTSGSFPVAFLLTPVSVTFTSVSLLLRNTALKDDIIPGSVMFTAVAMVLFVYCNVDTHGPVPSCHVLRTENQQKIQLKIKWK